MATYEQYKTAIGGLEAAKGAAESIHEYSEKARELDKAAKAAKKAGETAEKLSEAQDLMKGVKVFGKLASGLGMASIGLELALMAFGPSAPDPTELILGAIDKLDNKVDGLWDSMDKRFEEVLGKIDLAATRIMIDEELEYFEELHDVVSQYIQKRSKSDTQTLRSNIQTLRKDRYDPDGIYGNLVQISVKFKPDSDNNPLEATYKATNGELSAVMRLGNTLQKITQLAPMAYSLISALHFEKSDPDEPYALDSAADIEKKFKAHIEKINNEVNKYIEMCADNIEKNSLKDAQSMMQGLHLTGHGNDPRSYDKAANELWAKLAHKYFWLDWIVVVGCEGTYDEKAGSGRLNVYRELNDKERGSHFFPDEPCSNSEQKLTILIGWRSQDIPNEPYKSQKQKEYGALRKLGSNRTQEFLDGSTGKKEGGLGVAFGPKSDPKKIKKNPWENYQWYKADAPTGSLAWLCEDNIPYSAYWDPKNDINVVFACSNQEWFPPEIMTRLRKVNNFQGNSDISWLWFY